MSGSVNSNQFEMSDIPGRVDMGITNSGIIAGIIDADSAGDLVAGQRVKLTTGADGVTPVFKEAGVTETAIGTIKWNKEVSTYQAGDQVEVCLIRRGVIQTFISVGAIVAQASVEAVTAQTVQTKASSKYLGVCLTPVSASGKIVKVLLSDLALA